MRMATMSDSITTRSAAETKKIASRLAKKIAAASSDHARVIALNGNLGAGKTTFVQGFAKSLGINDTLKSPTFVLMKIYPVKRRKNLKHLAHIDAYRIETPREIKHLGLRELLNDKDAVILIEWADRIQRILPKDTIWLEFVHGNNESERTIKIQGFHKNIKAIHANLNRRI